MNEHTENDPRAELAALRQRLDKLEAEHRELQRQALRARRPAFSRKFLLTALVSLLLAVVGALWGDEAMSLFVDPKGYVGIGTNDPKARLDVNGSARFVNIGINHAPDGVQNMLITADADGKHVPFNITNPKSDVNWLTVFNGGNVVMNGGNVGIVENQPAPARFKTASPKLQVSGSTLLSNGTGESWFPFYDGDSIVSGTNVIFRSNGNTEGMRLTSEGKVGIGKTNPDAPLDVKGEIRGKPWTSQEYEWRNDQHGPTQMTKADRSVCFLTSVKSSQQVSVGIQKKDGYWVLLGVPEIPARATAVCIGAPDNSW
jgi:hypothetical protein